MVRRPDPEPCAACAAGECDLCDNGRYTSCGITGRDGYGAQRWCVPAAFAVRVDPRLGALGVLTEPTSVLVKAWERIDRVRATTGSDTALISGAGAMGLLAAMLAVARGYRTFVLARRWSAGRRELVRRTGATPVDPDGVAAACAPAVVLDTTGSADVVNRLAGSAARNAVVCLIGLTDAAADRPSLAPLLGRLVATNGLLFGTVNAAPRHYAGAVAALVAADPAWLAALITRRVPLASWPQALQRRPDDVKVVVDLTAMA
jgi:threonine dehydrogenase-like Zn-dependent dehydrogenase